MRFGKNHKKVGGRKHGSKNKKKLEKEKSLEVYQQAILHELKPLMSAHFAVAKGTQIIIARDKVWDEKKKRKVRKGRFVRITRLEDILELMNSDQNEGEDYYIIYTQDPNPKALEDLMNRVFGKPKEEMDLNVGLKSLKDIQNVNRKIFDLARKQFISETKQ